MINFLISYDGLYERNQNKTLQIALLQVTFFQELLEVVFGFVIEFFLKKNITGRLLE